MGESETERRRQVAYHWAPLELPSAAELAHDSASTKQFRSLAEAWASQRDKFMASSADALREFLGRLVRSWAIETGILERLYDLDAGATRILVEMGLREDLVERSASSLPPARLIAILRDHELAAAMVQDLVSNGRPLSVHFVRELHALLTRHQETTEAMTADGQIVTIPLQHGQFKTMPNNPLRTDGLIHEYCPSEQVDSEMEALLAGYEALEGEPAPFRAAWLHHRFTQIHPFQDGNGRIARALANFTFLKEDLFPLVVSRTDRARYLDALERADGGDLRPLVDMFAEIEADTLLKALAAAQVEAEGGRATTIEALVDRIAERHSRRIRDRQSVLRGVNVVAQELRDAGAAYIHERVEKIVEELQSRADLRIQLLPAQVGGPDYDNAGWWRFQLIEVANDLEYWVNFDEAQYWFRVTLRNIRNVPVNIQLVVSLHHFGHELTGVMRAAAFAEFEPVGHVPEGPTGPSAQIARRLQNCTPRSFTVTYQQSADTLVGDLAEWLDEALAMAVRGWHDLW